MTATKAKSAPVTESASGEVILQRVVFPSDADFDTLPLYAERGQARPGLEGQPDEESTAFDPERQLHPDLVLGRRSVTVPAGARVSFATYFNAFPAGYWRRWTSVESIRLRVKVSGTADVLVYRTSARGNQQRIDKQRATDGATLEFPLSLLQFGDGGWYWFDIVAGQEDAQLEWAEWTTEAPDFKPGRISIGITTFNRPEYCVDLLDVLGHDQGARAVIDTIFVIDQGTKKVEDQAGYTDAAKLLGDQLVMVHQPNLGGSGGFSRAMYETAYGESSEYVLLLDDDVLIEPEGILRAVTFADMCRVPTIIGGHMLNMHVRSLLHAYGETVDRYRFFWGPAPHSQHGHDFAMNPLRSTRWLHRRIDVDYNGWWMCLIPTEVVKKIGLSLPVFIKWDDAEFGLRAQKEGIPTVSLPGAAVWHVPWTDKDDTIDWQAYHHARNRLVVALLHSPYRRGGRLIYESFSMQIKHALSMQYTAAELRLWALEDILSGPDHMHRDLPTKLDEIREFRKGEDDSKIATDPLAFPSARRAKPPRRGKEPTEPTGFVGRYAAAAAGVIRQIQPVRPTSTVNPEVKIAAMDMRWRLLSQFDSAVVSMADGAGAAWFKRDRKRFTDVMRRSLIVHQKLALQWDDLAQQYRDAVPEVTDPQAWIATWNRVDDS